MTTTNFTGCDELREWLIAQGFRIAVLAHSSLTANTCNWYAYRASQIPARECEHNKRKLAQVVVNPYRTKYDVDSSAAYESAEVELTGEAGGIWFKLAAYSLSPQDLMQKLDQVERNLIAAWNAIHA